MFTDILELVKGHLEYEDDDPARDKMLDFYIRVAKSQFEQYTGKSLKQIAKQEFVTIPDSFIVELKDTPKSHIWTEPDANFIRLGANTLKFHCNHAGRCLKVHYKVNGLIDDPAVIQGILSLVAFMENNKGDEVTRSPGLNPNDFVQQSGAYMFWRKFKKVVR